MRVTQEQRGSLKLEAYAHLLQELLMLQLQQCTAASSSSLTSWQNIYLDQVWPHC